MPSGTSSSFLAFGMTRLSPSLQSTFGILLICAALARGSLAQVPTEMPEALVARSLIARLGTDADTNPVDTIKALHRYSRDAVPKLIEELRVVDPDKGDSEWNHVVWCERALRSMTGKVFKFRTSERLTSRQQEFLDPGEPMGYFAEWMSRGRVYVAPKDVQRAVIDAWHKWLAQDGKNFNTRQFSWEWDDWYF